MTSVQLAVLIAIINAAATGWSVFQGTVNPLLFAIVNMILGIAVGVARVIPQKKLREGDPE